MIEYNTEIQYNDFRIQKMRISEIIDLWSSKDNDISIYSEKNISREQCSRYIEALLIGLPLQTIFVDNYNGNWFIINGADRIKAYIDFCNSKYPLTSLYFKMSQYEGKYFDDLSVLAKKNILNTEVQVNVLNSGLSKQDRFGIYTCLKSRLDSNTLKQCRQIIYGNEYTEVVNYARNLAVELNAKKKSAGIENELLHLMIAHNYTSFLSKSVPYHFDFIANIMLEKGDFKFFINENDYTIKQVIKKSRNSKASRLGALCQDYYNAVLFHKHNEIISEDLFIKIIKDTQLMDKSPNSVETFCRGLDLLLNQIIQKSCCNH